MIEFLSLDKNVPADDYWDMTLLKDTLKQLVGKETDRNIVVIPGARQAELVDDINKYLEKYPQVLVIITSDEENNFPISKLKHPDMKIYVMYPNPERHLWADRFLPIGYPPMPKMEIEKKKLPWFYAGQVNHDSRQKLTGVLRGISGGKLIESEGFAQGLPYPEYLNNMNYASVVPSPGGPFSPDSFRIYEALELGAIPVPDHPEFWKMMYDEVPFPTLEAWDTLPELINNLKDRPEVNNMCSAWWQRQKRQLVYNLEDDLKVKPNQLTVLLPTSPIPSHPSTAIIEQTIESVRERLPSSEIILMIDGVRDEQEERKDNYNEYVRNLLWKCNHQYNGVYPLLFESHQHQANMAREALRHVRTPQVLYVEHDTPLDGEVPFEEISQKIASGEANLVRLMHEAHILEPHKYLMLDEGNRFTRTAQWSQRPHIASTDYYRKIIDDHFPVTGRTMIEDKMHGVLMNAWQTKGQAGWNEHKVWIYTPEGDMKRSLNLDGRQQDPKYDMKFE